MAGPEREPRAYELMTVFIPDLSEEDNQSQIERVSDYISNSGGMVKETLTESPWGRRRLAYEIRFNNVDYRDGYYTVYHFDSVPSFLTALERDLKLDTQTMRYLLVHDDPKAGEKFPQSDADEESEDAEATSDAPESAAPSSSVADTPVESKEASDASDENNQSDSADAPAEAKADESSDDGPPSASQETDGEPDGAVAEEDSIEGATTAEDSEADEASVAVPEEDAPDSQDESDDKEQE